MHQDADDSALILAARDGDRDAFAALISRYETVAFRAAYLVVRDAASAEDLAQEAFVRVYHALPSFRVDEPFRPWVVRIATNLALNDVRARGRRSRLLERFGRMPSESPPEPPDVVAASEAQRQLWYALQQLREEDRTVLYLRYYLELPEKEIALAIRKAPGTVKSRLSRASGRLRTVIERDYPGLRPGDIPPGGRS